MSKQAILRMDKRTGQQWLQHRSTILEGLWLREKLFFDNLHKHSSPHAQRARVVGQEVETTSMLILLLINMDKTLDDRQTNPFPNELSIDEARAWLAELRVRLSTKIRHECAYLKKCRERSLTPHQDAATEEDIQVERDLLSLINELLATFPPLQLSHIAPGEEAVGAVPPSL